MKCCSRNSSSTPNVTAAMQQCSRFLQCRCVPNLCKFVQLVRCLSFGTLADYWQLSSETAPPPLFSFAACEALKHRADLLPQTHSVTSIITNSIFAAYHHHHTFFFFWLVNLWQFYSRLIAVNVNCLPHLISSLPCTEHCCSFSSFFSSFISRCLFFLLLTLLATTLTRMVINDGNQRKVAALVLVTLLMQTLSCGAL